jgi:glycosyltransferase involved in cell wall biosynthesis
LQGWSGFEPARLHEGGGVDGQMMTADTPLVSVILATRNRPRFLPVALACYRHQTYSRRELIVVDDGDDSPADEARIASVGGRLIRMTPGTPLGEKLNRGVETARGQFCQKMDDDDWYAPLFLERMVATILESRREVCRPSLAFLMPFLFFDLARWEVRRSVDANAPGATLFFAREEWEARPFRPVRFDEDVWFLLDQWRLGAMVVRVDAPELFLAVRHQGARGDRGHTWTNQGHGEQLEAYVARRPLYEGGLEALLPAWALGFYRELHRELLSNGAIPGSLPLGARAP